MNEDKVMVGFNKYHSQMNELEFLRSVSTELYLNIIPMGKFREKMEEMNKKYMWWV